MSQPPTHHPIAPCHANKTRGNSDEQPPVFSVSIGNTHTSVVGWHSSRQPAVSWKTDSLPRNMPELCRSILSHTPPQACVIISGVVPKLKTQLIKLFKNKFSPIYIFRKNLLPQIEIIPQPPECVGDDRIAAALGALSIDSTVPWIVVDAGTALTSNVITPGQNGKLPRFEGGLIIPGETLSLKALAAHTAQLPHIEKKSSDRSEMSDFNFIGKNTEDAMRWGVAVAQRAALLAIIEGQASAAGEHVRIVITGGGAVELIGSRIMKATAEKSKRQDIFRCGSVFSCARTNKVQFKFGPPSSRKIEFHDGLVHLGLFTTLAECCNSRRRRE